MSHRQSRPRASPLRYGRQPRIPAARAIARSARASDRRRGIGAGHENGHEWSGADFGIAPPARYAAAARRRTIWPRARSAAAVRSASGSGRVTRSRMAQARMKKSALARSRNSPPASAPSSAAASRAAFAQNLECFAAVRLDDDAAEAERSVVRIVAWPPIGVRQEPSSTARKARSAASAVAGIGIIDRLDERAGSCIVRARFNADGALADGRHEVVGIENCRCRRQKPEPL